jgi:hypothetical protein
MHHNNNPSGNQLHSKQASNVSLTQRSSNAHGQRGGKFASNQLNSNYSQSDFNTAATVAGQSNKFGKNANLKNGQKPSASFYDKGHGSNFSASNGYFSQNTSPVRKVNVQSANGKLTPEM